MLEYLWQIVLMIMVTVEIFYDTNTYVQKKNKTWTEKMT